MSHRAGLRKEYSDNFLLDEAKLRKIKDIFARYGKKTKHDTYLEMYVGRENSSFYETTEIEEVLSDDNSLGKEIKTFAIELKAKDYKVPDSDKAPKDETIAYIAFTTGKTEKVVFFTAYEDRDWCFLLAEELDTQVQRLLKKRNKILSLRSLDLIILLSLISVMGLVLIVLLSLQEPELSIDQINNLSLEQKTEKILEYNIKKITVSDFSYPIYSFVTILFLLAIEVKPLARLSAKFQRSCFYWGDMIAIHDSYETKIQRIKWGIIIAFIISLISSFVVALVLP